MGPLPLVDRSVEKALDITDEQKRQIARDVGSAARWSWEGREGRGAGKGEGRGEGKGEAKGEGGAASFRERREKMEKEAMAVLTSDQQKKLEEMKGEKVEIDMSKLRGPGGPGGGREGRGRDRGKRGEPKESKSSS